MKTNILNERQHKFLQSLRTENTPHSGRRLFDHLNGTFLLLQRWGNKSEVCLAGLFHSIYGTQTYLTQCISILKREYVSEIIGPKVERLVYIHCTTDRSDLISKKPKGSEFIINCESTKTVTLKFEEFCELLELEAANTCEQLVSLRYENIELAIRAKTLLTEFSDYLTRKCRDDLFSAVSKIKK